MASFKASTLTAVAQEKSRCQLRRRRLLSAVSRALERAVLRDRLVECGAEKRMAVLCGLLPKKSKALAHRLRSFLSGRKLAGAAKTLGTRPADLPRQEGALGSKPADSGLCLHEAGVVISNLFKSIPELLEKVLLCGMASESMRSASQDDMKPLGCFCEVSVPFKASASHLCLRTRLFREGEKPQRPLESTVSPSAQDVPWCGRAP